MAKTDMASDLRIIAAVALKDIGDAVRNRTTLSIMLGSAVLMLSSMALPLLIRLNAEPTAVVYDPGRTTLIRALTSREEFQLGIVDSLEEMEEAVGSSAELRLGLVIPEGFAAASAEGDGDEVLEIEGYLPHWADPAKAAELTSFFEEQLAEASWRDIEIDVTGGEVYPTPATFGQHTMIAHTLAIVVLTVGLALVPGLLIEEKESHTLEALLVSPARYGHIVLSKGITGLFYSGIAVLVIYAVNAKWFVHGWAFLLAVGLGSLFAVTVGLLLGALIENPSSVGLWTAAVLIVLMVPAFVGSLVSDAAPTAIRTAIRAIPTSGFSELITLSTLRAVEPADWIWPALHLGISIAAAAGLLGWRVARLERAT
ncbi:MAG: ABC transporter permease [Anaerolineae bacterium]